MDIKEVFQRVNGRPATNEDLAGLVSQANALGISDQDTFISFLIILQHYLGLFDQTPAKIMAAMKAAADESKKIAETDLKRLRGQAQADLSAAVQKAAEVTAKAIGARTMSTWIALGSLVCAIVLLLVIGVTAKTAYRNGLAAGTVEMSTMQGFMATEDFKMAQEVAQNGQLHMLLTCSANGWSVDNGACYPGPFKDNNGKQLMNGWKLPKQLTPATPAK
jgi:hypothetical protein